MQLDELKKQIKEISVIAAAVGLVVFNRKDV